MDLAEHLVTSESPEECLDVRIERLPGQAFSDYRLGRGRGRKRVHQRAWVPLVRLTLIAEDGFALCWEAHIGVFKAWLAQVSQIIQDD